MNEELLTTLKLINAELEINNKIMKELALAMRAMNEKIDRLFLRI